jgi:peptide/nickel transport system substrate-binding protein
MLPADGKSKGASVAVDGSSDFGQRFTLNRRRFMQLGASTLALPLVMEASGGTALAAGKGKKVKSDPKAILQFGQMQGESYDPIRQVGVEYIQLYAIFDKLLSYSTNGTIEPQLATGYQATAEKVRLNLRTGVTFQDGTPFNAQAVQFSLNRVLHDPSSSVAANVSMLSSVEIVDSHTVDLMLSEPSVQALLFQLADRPGMIVSPAAVAKAGSSAAFSLKPVGAGPYAIDGAWFPREKMSVRSWPGYWDKSAQLLGGVDFTNVLEGATVNAMRAGSVDVNVLAAADATALKSDPSVTVRTGPGDFIMGLNINLTKPPFNNLKVRQAVSHAINRVAVNQALTAGLGAPAFQFATSNSPAYDASLNSLNDYSPSKARKLLKEAGYGKGLSFPSIIAATAAVYVQFGELIQSQLSEVGIKMDLQQINQADVIPMLWGSNGNHGTAISAPIGGGISLTGVAQGFATQTLSSGYQNTGGYEVPGIAPLLTAAASATTYAQSAALYKKANRLVTQNVCVLIPVYTPPSIIGLADYVGGNPPAITANGLPDFLRTMYISQGKKPISG